MKDRKIEQRNRITQFIEKAALQKHNIVLTRPVITECVYVLSSVYQIPDTHIAHMLSAMAQTPGLTVDIQFNLLGVISVWPGSFKDYGDAVLAVAARQSKGIILTFDQRFYRECIEAEFHTQVP